MCSDKGGYHDYEFQNKLGESVGGAAGNGCLPDIYICEENNQELVFWKELACYRRGCQFLDIFDMDDVIVIERACPIKMRIIEKYCRRYKQLASWQKQMKRIYGSRICRYMDRMVYEWIRSSYRDFHGLNGVDGVHTDERLAALDESVNYDIVGGFGTYQDWKKYEDLIRRRLAFKKSIQEEGDAELSKIVSAKKKVAVHFRRTDYLVMASLNLDDSYYRRALDIFDKDEYQFVIFSDDIEACRKMAVLDGLDTVFMEGHPAAVDMYLMTRCDGAIIANSTFSFWGAFLNENPEKIVVCPHDFVGGYHT